MLQHLPNWLGHALSGLRAGSDKVAVAALRPGEAEPIALTSTAFANGGRIPERFTADGEGVSPPLAWGPLPRGTEALVLLVEDADAPSPSPLVHAVVWDIDPSAGALEEGAIGRRGDSHPGGIQPETGRNSYLRRAWLPPDPPPGHGSHHYVFQLFALSSQPHLEKAPGRSALLDEISSRLIGAGVLTGTYSRGEEALSGPVGAQAATAEDEARYGAAS